VESEEVWTAAIPSEYVGTWVGQVQKKRFMAEIDKLNRADAGHFLKAHRGSCEESRSLRAHLDVPALRLCRLRQADI